MSWAKIFQCINLFYYYRNTYQIDVIQDEHLHLKKRAYIDNMSTFLYECKYIQLYLHWFHLSSEITLTGYIWAIDGHWPIYNFYGNWRLSWSWSYCIRICSTNKTDHHDITVNVISLLKWNQCRYSWWFIWRDQMCKIIPWISATSVYIFGISMFRVWRFIEDLQQKQHKHLDIFGL
jgi:hypothetical protein